MMDDLHHRTIASIFVLALDSQMLRKIESRCEWLNHAEICHVQIGRQCVRYIEHKGP